VSVHEIVWSWGGLLLLE